MVVGRGSGETEVFKEREATRQRRGADIYIYIYSFLVWGNVTWVFSLFCLGYCGMRGSVFFFLFFPDWGCYGAGGWLSVGGAVCRLPGGKHVEQ